jgi:ActR/RegA family two-component response regulator
VDEDPARTILEDIKTRSGTNATPDPGPQPAHRHGVAAKPGAGFPIVGLGASAGGLEALAIVVASGLDLPFVIVSGTIGEDTAVAAMKAGAHDYIMKGKLARLVPAIERELHEAEERRQHRRAEANQRLAVDALQLLHRSNMTLQCH